MNSGILGAQQRGKLVDSELRLHWRLLLLCSFNSREQIFQAVQRCVSFGIENLTEIFDGVGDVQDGFPSVGGASASNVLTCQQRVPGDAFTASRGVFRVFG